MYALRYNDDIDEDNEMQVCVSESDTASQHFMIGLIIHRIGFSSFLDGINGYGLLLRN